MDSIPIPVCKFGRARFNKTFRHKVAYGKCVSKKEIYYGFKLHALIALDGYLDDFTLTIGNIDDRIAVWELTENLQFSTVIGDKGYVGDKLTLDLKSENSISLISLKRNKTYRV
ncbi:transposase DDE domain protein [Clostridium puniceum]|uniref:Transposase DDE domain protein n=1 Tax=Clostridium puniceum TaxID=29367 RepID=A0A1S8TX59_9CLOT|nr:transposase DDE domain protein [Clostridium puniceum]